MDLRFGTFHSGRALAVRTLASPRILYTHMAYGVSTGPATLDRCCERNVVAPGEYSKWFFTLQSGFMGAISGPPPPGGYRPDRLSAAQEALTLWPSSMPGCRCFGPVPLPAPARLRAQA